MNSSFKLLDFNAYNERQESGEVEEGEEPVASNIVFLVQMFGINEIGKTCSITVENFQPFFYVKVNNSWTEELKMQFLKHIKERKEIGAYYAKSITSCKLVEHKTLYGFDGGKLHKFIVFHFENQQCFNKVKNLWYRTDAENNYRHLPNGYTAFKGQPIHIYESNIPPLLRFFHIKDISPSGWIEFPLNKAIKITDHKTTCDYEYLIDYKYLTPLNNKESRVPYKICSFDIEASSSHGDFPVPVKTYKKLVTNIVEYFEKNPGGTCQQKLRNIIWAAFGHGEPMIEIDVVYPIVSVSEKNLNKRFDFLLSSSLDKYLTIDVQKPSIFEKQKEEDDEEEGGEECFDKEETCPATIIDLLGNMHFNREKKIFILNNLFDGNEEEGISRIFPKLHGDKVTFIGSTFLNYGDADPYKNHCIVLNNCDPVDNVEIECYPTEKEVLLAWSELIQRENPDIIIGYNIFGFDYEFMFQRSVENDCTEEFLQLSRNIGEICGNKHKETGQYALEESSVVLASGQHDFKYVKTTGRLQIDMYNFFRKEENLTSYKLDFVAGHFIGDIVKKVTPIESDLFEISSGNLTGLIKDSFIHFEIIAHTVDYFDNGQKFKVQTVNKSSGKFTIHGSNIAELIHCSKKIRWCLAKDDVTPKDIFRMTNGSDADRAVIAKYCIQDCNLVHYIANKVDVITGFVEMSKICSVPISFLVLRGQGIKLTSYVSKKCREKNTLLPVLEKGTGDDGYEGAIVLEPKCDLYLDNPVACVDYASLYPSSMLSENLSHDSKVWTKEYNLNNELISEWGEKNTASGEFLYDNLPGYSYVNVTYDTFKYVRKSAASATEKIKSGYKICRFAQFPRGRAIMPSILEELLSARKNTRKLIPQQTDEFMKNVLDKRQLAYKLTANSLYGQCGAKTSTFYEKDVAASTTATGRMLLLFAKKVIEECYGDKICETAKHGPVRTKAEYIYGDTDSVFFTFNLETVEGEKIRGQKALEITIELAQEAGHLASSCLKAPHDLEYEKTFMPFCLLSKKRYVGMLYETDPTKCKRKEMGIVLKRRDNAPIVKDIYGGIIDILMKEQNIEKAVEFLKNCLKDIVDGNCPLDKLIITKSLRSGYKNPGQIAHKVLADRITERDPGNKPGPGDRISFAYICSSNKKALQGEKIETPAFIIEQGLKVDNSFYITNQIMKPVQQVFALVLQNMWKDQKKFSKISRFKKEVDILRASGIDQEKFEEKLTKMKNAEVKILLFDEFLRETNNAKQGNQSIFKFFKK